MDKLQRRLFFQSLNRNKWAIIFVAVFAAFFAYIRLGSIEPTVKAPCTIISKGVGLTHLGNEPQIRCELSNGYQKVVKVNNAASRNIGDVIYVQVKKSNTLHRNE